MIVLQNVRVMQFEPERVENGIDIVIDGGIIKEIGSGIGKNYTGEDIRDFSGKVVMPGLVCSHNHFYSGLARGIIADIKPSTDFISQLQNLWWKLDRALDSESVYYSGIICALEAIKAGTTSVIDHHSSQNFITGSLTELKKGFEEAGLRGVLCFEVTDRNGPEGLDEGIVENIDFIHNGGDSSLVCGMLGGHAPFTISDVGLRKLGDAAEKTGKGFHIHAGEDKYDGGNSHAVFKKDLLERLDEFGLVNEKSIFAHGIYFTNEDREILNRKDAFLVHNCRSNMNNNVGYNGYLPEIKNCALGTDGIGGDMFDELKFAFFKHRDAGGPLWPDSFLRFLQNGNAMMERHFGGKFGRLEPGYAADLTILDYDSPTCLEPANLGGHFAFGFSSRDVHTVIINGKFVYENRQFPEPVNKIYAEAAQAANALWKRMDELQ